jgi:hypothetical protein
VILCGSVSFPCWTCIDWETPATCWD